MSRFGIIPASAFDADLKPAQIALLSLLSTYADKTGYCWPSRETLADKLNMSPAWVTSNMQELQRSGFVKVTQHQGRKYGFYINYDTKSYGQNTDLNGQPADTNNTNNNKNIYKRKSKTSISDNFELEPETITWCLNNRPDIDLKNFTEDFILRCKAKNYQYIDWQSAFKSWIKREKNQSNVTKLKKPDLREINTAFQTALDELGDKAS